MRFNSVTIMPIRSVEIGDLVVREFLGSVVSGVVTGNVSLAHQLTNDQRKYMTDHDIDIPNDLADWVSGMAGQNLVFGEFSGTGINHDQPGHMFVDFNHLVAVFPYKKRYDRVVSYNQKITDNVLDARNFVEHALSDCANGCKIYKHSVTDELVLAHNSAYGCRR